MFRGTTTSLCVNRRRRNCLNLSVSIGKSSREPDRNHVQIASVPDIMPVHETFSSHQLNSLIEQTAHL